MVCLTVFHSADPEGLGLRMAHAHCSDPNGNQKEREGGGGAYDVECVRPLSMGLI
jgi:hypothetical protein